MKISQHVFESGVTPNFPLAVERHESRLIFYFGSTAMLADNANFLAVRAAFPEALIVGCSTAGEIHDSAVSDDGLVVTDVVFERTQLRMSKTAIAHAGESFAAGQALADALPAGDLSHVLVFPMV